MVPFTFSLLQPFIALLLLAITDVLAGNVIGVDSLSDSETRYGIIKNFCRLLAHKTLVIGDKLIIDGGMAKFKITLANGTDVEVPDLNPFTVTLDLSSSFSIDTLPLTEHRRPTNVPVLNRFIMWQDPSNRYYYVSGGHFYNAMYWNQSEYYVEDKDVPGYNIWRYDLQEQKWSEEEFDIDGGGEVKRLISSADVSIPNQGVSFAYGGYSSRRSRPNGIDDDRNLAENSLLIYNHATHTIRNVTKPPSTISDVGLWHGALHHLPLGPKGFLVALMGEAQLKGRNFSENDITGREDLMLDWKSVQIWDIEKERWYTQRANFYNDEVPKPRSRFCSVLAYDEESNRWDIWVYGGQDLKNPENGVSDIWVLSMPSFMWTRIIESSGAAPIRTHSCRAFGSQLMIIGGYPPGYSVNPTESCGDSRLIRIYNMNDASWPPRFDPKAPKYKQNSEIARNSRLDNDADPLGGWGHDRLKEAFAQRPTPTPTPIPGPVPVPTGGPQTGDRPKSNIPAIVGGVVGGVVVLLLLLCLCCGRNPQREWTFGIKASWWHRRWFEGSAQILPPNGRATDSQVMPPYELPPDVSRNAYLAPKVISPIVRDIEHDRSSSTPSRDVEGGATRISGYGSYGVEGAHTYYGRAGSVEDMYSGPRERPDRGDDLSPMSDATTANVTRGPREELREGASIASLREERRRRGKEDYAVHGSSRD